MTDRPTDEAGIAAAVMDACAAREPLLVHGGRTKPGMLRPVQAARSLDVSGCVGITLYSSSELVLSARAGTPLAEIEATLAQAGQHLIAEPPDYSGILALEGARGAQTVGGIVATNLSGPRRIAGGAMRDHVLGVRAVNGAGTVIKSGGRVLKNVTGLDVCKLLAGSHGTLAVMTEITLKVLPKPEGSASVVLLGLDAARGVAALSAALGSPYGVTGAAFLPAELSGGDTSLTVVRIESFADSVAYRSEAVRQAMASFGGADILPEAASTEVWASIRDARMLRPDDGDAIWRVSVRPSRGPVVLDAIQRAGGTGFLDWGGGLVLAMGKPSEALQTAIQNAGGVWTVLRGPAPWRAATHVVPPEPPPLAALSRRLKAAFDPAGILMPGRIYPGL